MFTLKTPLQLKHFLENSAVANSLLEPCEILRIRDFKVNGAMVYLYELADWLTTEVPLDICGKLAALGRLLRKLDGDGK